MKMNEIILVIIILIISLILIVVTSFNFLTYNSFIASRPLMNPIMLSSEERFDYYVEKLFQSNYQSTRFAIEVLQKTYPNEFASLDESVLTFDSIKRYLSSKHKQIRYFQDLYSIWEQLPSEYKTDGKKIVWYPHDRVERFIYPVIVKSRWVMDRSLCPGPHHYCSRGGSILFKLNQGRHFELMNKLLREGDPVSFERKKKRVVWRGSATGYGFGNNIPFRPQSREILVRKYGELPSSHPIDVGLINAPEEYKKYEKPVMTIAELLQYRYLISVEGNDVATNLKWIMASNSIVMMPKPRIESWYLEGELIPYVHYIPLKDDFSDLWTQYLQAEENLSMCKQIIHNAQQYSKQYTDTTTETQLQRDILIYYLDHFLWI